MLYRRGADIAPTESADPFRPDQTGRYRSFSPFCLHGRNREECQWRHSKSGLLIVVQPGLWCMQPFRRGQSGTREEATPLMLPRPYRYAHQLQFQVENYILNVKHEQSSWGARKHHPCGAGSPRPGRAPRSLASSREGNRFIPGAEFGGIRRKPVNTETDSR